MDHFGLERAKFYLDGGNSALVIGFLVETNFEASKTLQIKSFSDPQKLS